MNYDSSNPTKHVKQKAVDRHFLVKIVNKVTEYKHKKLLANEIEGLVHYVNKLNFSLLKNETPDKIIDKIARNFTQQMNMQSGAVIDTHEMLKREIGTIAFDKKDSVMSNVQCPPYNPFSSHQTEGYTSARARNTRETNSPYITDSNFNGIPDIIEPSLHNTPHAIENNASTFSSTVDKYPRIKKQPIQNVYLCLDGYDRNLSTNPSTFKWTVVQSNNTQQGTVNTLVDNIHNIVNVQFERFSIPYVSSADNVYKKITCFIEEFSNQSVLIRSSRRYHMMFTTEIQGNQIQLTPQLNDEGRFRFHTPVNILDTLTLTFMSPFVPIVFKKDRYNVTITSINPTQSYITFTENHEVSDGELVHIVSYSTAASTDSLSVSEINRESGHIVTFINNNILRIDVNLSTVTHDPANIASCFIATRRLIMPIRMEYLV